MIFVMMALVLSGSEAGVCGNAGQCRCTNSGDVICAGVKSTPFFMEDLRAGMRMTLKATANFDVSTLVDAEGFDRVMIIGLTTAQCKLVDLEFPSVMCLTETPSYKPATPNSATSTISATSTKSSTTETNTGTTETAAAGDEDTMTTGIERSGLDDETTESEATLTGLIIYSALYGIFGFLLTMCVLVSLVNLHERINAYTACNDSPMFAVSCCLCFMAVLIAPCYCCSVYCRKCPGCCVHAAKAGVTMRQPAP